jgi:hypothetical protein
MNAIRITQKLESDTLHLPELLPWVGRQVEIVVREAPDATPTSVFDSERKWVSPLAGTVHEYRDPFEPAVLPEDWEANS